MSNDKWKIISFARQLFLIKPQRLKSMPLGSHRGITVASTVDHELIDCEFDRDDEKTPVVCGRFDPSRTNDQRGSTG